MLQIVANSQTSGPLLGPLSIAVAGVGSDGRTSYVVDEGTQLGGIPFTGISILLAIAEITHSETAGIVGATDIELTVSDSQLSSFAGYSCTIGSGQVAVCVAAKGQSGTTTMTTETQTIPPLTTSSSSSASGTSSGSARTQPTPTQTGINGALRQTDSTALAVGALVYVILCLFMQ